MNNPDSLRETLDQQHPDIESAGAGRSEVDDVLLVTARDEGPWLDREDWDDWQEDRGGRFELPPPEDRLDTYEAMMLYNFLCTQMDAPQLVFQPSSDQPADMYDWFVNSLNFAPLGDVLFNFIERLAAWKKTTRKSKTQRDDPSGEGPMFEQLIDWSEFPGIRA